MTGGRYRDYYYGHYAKSTPIKTEGGMKVRTKKGEIGNKWWSKKLLSVLSTYGWNTRLDRGKRYARSGQVLRIHVGNGVVESEVQGSRSTPYKLSIKFPVVVEKEWKDIISTMKERPEFISSLLSGEVPPELEEIFADAKSPLFPSRGSEITMNCNCPDYANPCKHIAAVFFVLADNLDEDPFLLLQLKGKTKEELMKSLSSFSKEEIAPPGPVEKIRVEKVSAETLLNFWDTPSVTLKRENTEQGRSIPPIKKYSFPMEFSDEDVSAILLRYYYDIGAGLSEVRVNE